MKKVIVPFLFALLLGVSSANAVDMTAQQSNVGKANLTSVLGSYDGGEIQFLALAENSQPIFETKSERHQRCNRLCTGEKDYSRCMKICENS